MVAIQKIKLGSTWVCLALVAGMLVGCSSSSSQNKRVYDRYAALVAERSQAAQSGAGTKVKKSSSRSASKPKASLNRTPHKGASTAPQSAPAKTSSSKKASVATPPPVQVIEPAPVMPAENPEPVSVAASTPAPVQAVPAPAVASPAPPADNIAGYRLKIGDGIQIFLRGIPTPEAIEDIIDGVGMIALPLINEVQAAGLTASELERSIRKMYLDKDIYRNISVNVVVPTRFYFIQGEIKAPGRFQIMSATRVSQAIAGAGGYSEYASGKVLVKRDGKIFKIIRNAKRLERAPDDDIMLEPDDIIEVQRSMW